MRFVGADGVERQAGEVFWVSDDGAFDVSAAQALLAAAPREPEWVDLDLCHQMILAGQVRVDVARADRVDTDEPGIGVEVPGGVLLIDGWHRALRRLLAGWTGMPVCLLTAAEAAQIRGHVPADERARYVAAQRGTEED